MLLVLVLTWLSSMLIESNCSILVKHTLNFVYYEEIQRLHSTNIVVFLVTMYEYHLGIISNIARCLGLAASVFSCTSTCGAGDPWRYRTTYRSLHSLRRRRDSLALSGDHPNNKGDCIPFPVHHVTRYATCPIQGRKVQLFIFDLGSKSSFRYRHFYSRSRDPSGTAARVRSQRQGMGVLEKQDSQEMEDCPPS